MAMDDGHSSLRASDADREQAIEVLKAAFVEDQLTKAEIASRTS